MRTGHCVVQMTGSKLLIALPLAIPCHGIIITYKESTRVVQALWDKLVDMRSCVTSQAEIGDGDHE